ncbi:MAG: M56 family metallopeptidase [Ruminococcus sp.]|nr:M56 family metallopeptidase [Ruminococcus sp.]
MSQIFIKILNMSLSASYCIAVVMVLRLFLKKQPKILSYLLWSVVLFRLICPFTFSGDYSLMRLDDEIISQETIMRWSGAGNENGMDAAETSGDVAGEAVKGTDIQELQEKSESGGTAFWIQRLIYAASWIWSGGVWLLLCYSIIKAVMMACALRGAVRLEGNCYAAEGVDTPFVFGLIRPRIYLPAHLQAEDKKYVLEHEKIHIARKDHLVKVIAYMAVCIHWFNPLVWFAFLCMEKDMEMSCDEAVLRKFGMDVKKEYSLSLLALSTKKAAFYGSPSAFAEGKVKDRIRNVLTYRKRTFLAVLVTAIILAGIGIGLLVNPARKEEPAGVNEEEEPAGVGEEDKEKIAALVEDYAKACCARDGAPIVALYTDEETALINGESRLLEKAGDGYTFGWSSPWPDSYRYEIVWEEERADIRYYAWTSDPHVCVWREEIQYTKIGEEYRISASSLEILDSISSAEEFERAYRISGEYRFVDYVENGYVEAINFQRDEPLALDNGVYEAPESAAEYILNLTGGESFLTGGSSIQVMVRYRFADGSEATIPMYDANYDLLTDSRLGEPLWIVDTAVWNAGAP